MAPNSTWKGQRRLTGEGKQLGSDWKNKQEPTKSNEVGADGMLEGQHEPRQRRETALDYLSFLECWDIQQERTLVGSWGVWMPCLFFVLFSSNEFIKKTSPMVPHRAQNFSYVKKMCFVRTCDNKGYCKQ